MKDCRKRNSVQPEGCAASSLLCRPSAWRTSPAAPSPWARSGSIAPSVVRTGLVRALEERARVHTGTEPPEDDPSCVILCPNGLEDLFERVERYRELSPGTPPVLVFGSQLDLPLARDALKAGAFGFVHVLPLVYASGCSRTAGTVRRRTLPDHSSAAQCRIRRARGASTRPGGTDRSLLRTACTRP